MTDYWKVNIKQYLSIIWLPDEYGEYGISLWWKIKGYLFHYI